jgi:SAM-dependent methyltransferase
MTSDPNRLTDNSFWNDIYQGRNPPSGPDELTYPHAILWEDILPQHVTPGGSVLEIGSAPGVYVARFARLFGYEPFGLEYTVDGVAQNRAYFAARGHDPDNVIHADLFDDAAIAPLEARFDAVISFGFIEHFEDPAEAIERHIRLCKPGGLLVLTVPNMRRFNWLTMRLLEPHIEPHHNLSVMSPKALERLFDPAVVEKKFAGYYGGYNFTNRDVSRRWQRPIALVMMNLAPIVHGALNKLRPRRFESATFSPYIAFVGRKRAPA